MSDPADLSNLRDIVVPSEVSPWPLAPGWWIVAAGGVFALGLLAATIVLRHRRNGYRREALRALEAADAQNISTVLKRAALAAWPREQVASLSGPAWLAFLDRTGGTTAFTAGPGHHVETLAFGGTLDEEATDAARAAAQEWLRDHKAPTVVPSAARDL